MQLKDKKAIITGGSQGIGKGIAIGLAQGLGGVEEWLIRQGIAIGGDFGLLEG